MISNTTGVNTTINGTTVTPRLRNEDLEEILIGEKFRNNTLPLWGFDSPCDWDIATSVNLGASAFGLLNNTILLLLPFFLSHLRHFRGLALSSYSMGAFMCTAYSVCFHVRFLIFNENMISMEKVVLHAFVVFEAYQTVLHMAYVTWNEYKKVFRFVDQQKYLTKSIMKKLIILAWVMSAAHPVIDVAFLDNLMDLPEHPQITEFRLVCATLVLFFFWLVPLLTMLSWDAEMFCFLLKITHNGHEVVELSPPDPSNPTEFSPADIDLLPEDEDEYGNEPKELPTLPDNTPLESRRSFARLCLLTACSIVLFIWLTYYILALCNQAELTAENINESIRNCYLYNSLHFTAMLIPIINPLAWLYYGEEMHRALCFSIVPWKSEWRPVNKAQ